MYGKMHDCTYNKHKFKHLHITLAKTDELIATACWQGRAKQPLSTAGRATTDSGVAATQTLKAVFFLGLRFPSAFIP